jgi:hypothetical protein
MFKVEVTYGSDPIAQAALNRRVHDRLGGGWRLERLAFEDAVEEARAVLGRSESVTECGDWRRG